MNFSNNVAIIVAAGKGERMKSRLPKQFLTLNSQPILWHTLIPFLKCPNIHQIILPLPEAYKENCQNEIIKPLLKKLNIKVYDPPKVICINGGKRRQDSVYSGLMAIEKPASIVVIHDGVRPFITENQISELINQAKKKKAVIFGVSPRDTIKKINSNKSIADTIERSQVQMAQTPQAFSYDLIKRAHFTGKEKKLDVTDDAMLVEHLGEAVYVEPGHPLNIKITTPDDLILAKGIFKAWPPEESFS
ncbi:2-C-methyl-D-erythritol 4-phosphate cytidylyltransferase [Candidatus Magnetomorum sp. HK-1]|nr:2-C-methyl-D-erythritol 4-phosphate cytidylyltransferase [Candidatus Magnetomorum sp. HK-1]